MSLFFRLLSSLRYRPDAKLPTLRQETVHRVKHLDQPCLQTAPQTHTPHPLALQLHPITLAIASSWSSDSCFSFLENLLVTQEGHAWTPRVHKCHSSLTLDWHLTGSRAVSYSPPSPRIPLSSVPTVPLAAGPSHSWNFWWDLCSLPASFRALALGVQFRNGGPGASSLPRTALAPRQTLPAKPQNLSGARPSTVDPLIFIFPPAFHVHVEPLSRKSSCKGANVSTQTRVSEP